MDLNEKINSLEQEIKKWEKRFTRERRSRKHSENLLEEKSLALWKANQGLEEEVKKRTLSLEDALLKLQEADEAKTNFLANISHELKTPLNSINILSALMIPNKKGNLLEVDVRNLNIINKSGKYLVEIINDILDISKLEIGELDINIDKTSLKDIMNDIHEIVNPQMIEKNLNFIFSLDDSIDYIFSDKKRIKQIVKNLLSNSLKFTEDGNISFIVSNEEDNFKITIEDEGIGIPSDRLEHIFDRFKQVDETTTRKYGGTGLGLAICKELVTLLEGQITVSSKLGVGTKFEVILPKNEHLLKSNSAPTFTSKKTESTLDKLDEISLDIIDKKSEKTKDKLYLINSDPIGFFKIVNELKQKFEVISISNIKEVDLKLTNKLFLSSKVLDNNIKKCIKDMELSLILLIEDDKIIKDIDNNIIRKIDTPIKAFDFSSLII